MVYKRAVSPLIATILLIALTVSIGAMIIGWGRQYVQQQTGCLGIALSITDAEVDTSNKKLTLWIQNTGSQNVKVSDLRIYYYDVDGNRKTIKLDKTDNFNVGGKTTQILRPGQIGKLVKTDNELDNCDKILEVEIERIGCGVVSNRFPVYKCS